MASSNDLATLAVASGNPKAAVNIMAANALKNNPSLSNSTKNLASAALLTGNPGTAGAVVAADYAIKNPEKSVKLAGWVIAIIIFVVIFFVLCMFSLLSTSIQQVGRVSESFTMNTNTNKNNNKLKRKHLYNNFNY